MKNISEIRALLEGTRCLLFKIEGEGKADSSQKKETLPGSKNGRMKKPSGKGGGEGKRISPPKRPATHIEKTVSM